MATKMKEKKKDKYKIAMMVNIKGVKQSKKLQKCLSLRIAEGKCTTLTTVAGELDAVRTVVYVLQPEDLSLFGLDKYEAGTAVTARFMVSDIEVTGK